jgi:hypothetical protein
MTQAKSTQMVPRQIVTATTCDGCGKTDGPSPDGWNHFSSHHSDWGNDSVDSYDYWDACSFACYLQIVSKAFADYPPTSRNPSLEIDDKDWFFIRDMLDATRGLGRSEDAAPDSPEAS